MDAVIAKVGPEANIEVVEQHSGKIKSRFFVTPQDGAYLARGILACAAELCGSNPPPPGKVLIDTHIPVLRWTVDASHGELVLTVTIQSGIELAFKMPLEGAKSVKHLG
jgi:hypothetical protein